MHLPPGTSVASLPTSHTPAGQRPSQPGREAGRVSPRARSPQTHQAARAQPHQPWRPRPAPCRNQELWAAPGKPTLRLRVAEDARAQQGSPDGVQDQRAMWRRTAQAPPSQKQDAAGRRRPPRVCAPPPFLTCRPPHTRVSARLAAHTPSTRWPACSGHCRGMRRRSVPRIPTQASSSPSQDTQPSRLAPSRSQPDPVPFAVMAVPVLPSPSPPKARTGSSMPCPKLRLWGPAS